MVQPPVIPSATEIYDAIMSAIEPDLISSANPLLAEKYSSETDAEKKVRKERYKKAFKEYDAQYTEASKRLMSAVRSYKKDSFVELEKRVAQENAELLSELESTIASF